MLKKMYKKYVTTPHNIKTTKSLFSEIEKGDVGGQRLTHDWYMKANKMCEHNAYNMFTQGKSYTWEDVFDE